MTIQYEIAGVRLHHDFVNGKHNDGLSVDLKNLTFDELKALTKWIKAIYAEQEHDGVNKPSYVKSNGDPAPDAKRYVRAEAWHYHCGPTFSPHDNPQKTKWYLPINLKGLKSAECAHYSRIVHSEHSVNCITVFAFSRDHKPFPPSDNNHRSPYRKKMETLSHSIDWGEIYPPSQPTLPKP